MTADSSAALPADTAGAIDSSGTAGSSEEPNPTPWVRQQLAEIDAAGSTRAVQVQDRDVVVISMRGVKSGKTRRVPLMRVEHDGTYVAVASKGGAPNDPVWAANLAANPDVRVQDGTVTGEFRARLANDSEREQWWPRCVEAFPPYAEYQTKTDRQIPLFLLEPR